MLGQAVAQALGDKRGIRRFGHAVVPMDEALAEAAVDISGRPFLAWSVGFERPKVGEMDTELFEEFFRAFATNALVDAARDAAGRPQRPSRRRSLLQGRRAGAAHGGRARSPRGDAVPSTKGAL